MTTRARAEPDAAGSVEDGAAGADVGSTLAKLALPGPGGEPLTETHPADDLQSLAARLQQGGATRVGLTGAGAARLAEVLALPHRHFDESLAWAAGARPLADTEASDDAFLLVSMGTGTSVMRVEPEAVTRVGGTALGGGTLLGLGYLLAGAESFEELAQLAVRGDRSRVDLTIGDVYAGGPAPLPAQATAAAFGKLAHAGSEARPEDLAAAVVGLVGENAGLLCMALAQGHGARCIVFGGSALHGNPALEGLLGLVCLAFGATPRFPEAGPYLGALGARALVRAETDLEAGPTR